MLLHASLIPATRKITEDHKEHRIIPKCKNYKNAHMQESCNQNN